MEYDNDRTIKPTAGIELCSWIGLLLIYPLVNGLGSFPRQGGAWWPLVLESILLMPLYVFYARYIVPRFLFNRRWLLHGMSTLLFFGVLHLVVYGLYAIALLLMNPSATWFFLYNGIVFIRETVWMIVISSLSVGIAYLRTKLSETAMVTALQKENTYYKLRYFRTQLNPHFLFNTLNNIYALSLTNTARTPEVVIRLADSMRFLIYECNEDKIPVEKEIDFIRNYIEIERIRYDADIRFTIEGDTGGLQIEPFLFISFIENGFKHAIDNSFARPFIYITLKVSPHQIALNVINNTSLELEAQSKKIRGRGLENSKSVLELLYPDAYALDIIQTEKRDRKESKSRMKNAQERLQRLYPDAHTLDVILSHNTFTVSLVINAYGLKKTG